MKKRYYMLFLAMLAISFFYDRQILIAVSAYRTATLDKVFNFFTLAGTFIPIPLLIISAIMLYKKNRNIASAWLSVLVAVIAAYTVKYIVNRDRPDFTDNTYTKAEGPSFPSAHAAVSFAPVALLKKTLKASWIIFAVLVAFSRIYLGVHYTSDVIAGAMLGYIIGEVFAKTDLLSKIKLFKKLRIA